MSKEKEFGLQNKYLPKNIAPIPVFFIKSPFFTPSSKNSNRIKELRKIELNKFYGYETIKLTGVSLNLNLDFKILAGLLKVRDDIDNNYVSISILDFAELIGHKRNSISKTTKKAIEESFNRLLSQTVSFTAKNSDDHIQKVSMFNIINNIDIDFDAGNIDIDFNEKIINVYQKDKYVQYVNMETFNNIKGEVAKALWLFYEANSKFTKFKISNLEKRLVLKQTKKKEINRQIKKGHEELKNKGYITSYSSDSKTKEYKILRHKNKR